MRRGCRTLRHQMSEESDTTEAPSDDTIAVESNLLPVGARAPLIGPKVSTAAVARAPCAELWGES